MHLNKEENQMLEGAYGEVVQKALELLVSIGACFDAEKLIPIRSGHLLANLNGIGRAGASYIHEMAEKGGKCAIFTDTNPRNVEAELVDELGLSVEFAKEEQVIIDAYSKMGVSLPHTCTPYLIGHSPRLHEHIAWNESSAIIFANSVLGARTNREGGPTALAASLTGRVPEYGYHLQENRYGDLLVLVNAEMKHSHDFGTLGYFVGRVAGDRVPVFAGLQPSVSMDGLKLLGAAAASSGSVALFHAIGITPEAQTVESAFGHRKPADMETLEFNNKELKQTEEILSRSTKREVDIVILGCPHASITELREIARLLHEKKLKPTTSLWVSTSRVMKQEAHEIGLVDIIESSGAKVTCDVCPIYPAQQAFGPGTVATNSPKLCYYISQGPQSLIPHYGSLERCVEAALTGVWG